LIFRIDDFCFKRKRAKIYDVERTKNQELNENSRATYKKDYNSNGAGDLNQRKDKKGSDSKYSIRHYSKNEAKSFNHESNNLHKPTYNYDSSHIKYNRQEDRKERNTHR